jgi:hypothetical protein
MNWQDTWRAALAVGSTKGEKTMTDATPAGTLAATASDTAAADSSGPRNPEDTTLFGKLSAALTGIAGHPTDPSDQRIGCWSDEPLRLADFVA